MQQHTPAFIVTSANLTPSLRFLEVKYKENGSDRPLSTTMGAVAFEKYLQSMHDVDCPTLKEWIARSPLRDIHKWVAAFMECLMWENQEAAREAYENREAA